MHIGDLTPARDPKLEYASETANRLMTEHGLFSWTFAWDSARERVGNCSYSKRTLSLSKLIVPSMTESQIRDVILHEIAHALAGPYTNHGSTWQRIALSIGCSATRCAEDIKGATAKWRLTCPNGHIAYRHRRTSSKVSCGECSPYFNEEFLFEWEANQ